MSCKLISTLRLKDSKEILKFFGSKKLNVSYISKTLHDKLVDIRNFIELKSLLNQVPEMNGLLLLPKDLIPQVVDEDVEWLPQHLKMNCILFSLITNRTHDMMAYGKSSHFERDDFFTDEEYEKHLIEYEGGRWLKLIPIQLDKFFHIHRDSLSSLEEEFGNPYSDYGRGINGNIVDYVWSFVLFYNFTEGNSEAISCNAIDKSNQIKIGNEIFLNESLNHIEIIHANCVTR